MLKEFEDEFQNLAGKIPELSDKVQELADKVAEFENNTNNP